MSQRKWIMKKVNKDAAAQLSQEYDMNPFLALILVSRGHCTSEAVASFASAPLELLEPMRISGMKEATQRICLALDQGEKIAVYGDFDADGVTATVLLSSFLESQGGNVMTYIPERDREGYGLHIAALEELASQGVRLLITVDNGISALKEAEAAAALGMDLVITDHHQPGPVLPHAVAVVDPHLDKDLPFHDWAGVGVAFKLVSALYDGSSEELLEMFGDLVAIGTVGDIVPLTGENRLLVKKGMQVLNESERMGLRAFREVTDSQDHCFTATDLAFRLVPRVNAAGRMHTAQCALDLLLTDDYEKALLYAQQLCDYNSQRQEQEQVILTDIFQQLDCHPERLLDRVLVVDGAAYHNGVIGIVAARLVERYGKPCIVLNRQEDGVARGSCRSVDGFSIYEALAACRSDLLQFGGHPMAAGLSLENDSIDLFRTHINAYAQAHYPVMPPRSLTIDCRIAPAYLTLDLLDELAVLEPYGAENEQPVFGLFRLHLQAVTPVGGGKHLRLTVSKAGRNYQMMYFGMTEEQFPFSAGDEVDAAVKIARNLFNGRESVSVQICDMKPSKLEQDCYFQEKAVYGAFLAGESLEKQALHTLCPAREQSGAVYRWLVRHTNQWIGTEQLYYELAGQGITYGQLAVSLEAFVQTGLAERKNGVFRVLPSKGKVDLDSAEILTQLKSRVNDG